MSNVSLVRIRISVNGLPRDDWELDVDKAAVSDLVHALDAALNPFIGLLEEES